MKNKSVWLKVLYYTKEQTVFYIIRIILTVLIVILENFIVVLNSYAIDNYIVSGLRNNIGKFSMILIIAVLGLYFISMLWHYIAIFIEGRSIITLQSLGFQKLHKLSPSYFDKESAGDLLARLRNDIEVIAETLFFPFNDLIVGISGAIISFVFLFSLDFMAGLLAVILTPIIILIVFLFIKKKVELSKRIRDAVSGYITVLDERITAIQTVKALLLERESVNEFNNKSKEALKSESQKEYFNTFSALMINIVVVLGTIIILQILGTEILNGVSSVGNITAVITIFTTLSINLSNIVNSLSTFKENEIAGKRILEVIEAVPSMVDDDAVIQKYGDYITPHRENWEKIEGKIEFNHVYFEYIPGKPILEDFCLTVMKGEKLAIVGNTGGGKTTIINLAARFYEPQRGEILIDNRSVKERSQFWLQSNLGYILQQPMLLSGSVLYNLKYGNENVSEDEIIQKAKECSLDELVMNHKEGYNTDISELSTGERQLITIVRAIISEPQIVLMDEATSSIDSVTDRNIQNAIEKLLENRTCIIVAHRLSTVVNADRIIVIDEGKIVEEGTHISLMQKQGAYYRLYMAALEKEMYDKVMEVRTE